MKRGFSFGIVSGIITTLGLLIGLATSTESKIVVIGGIAVIAIADALSDSLGMHVSTEAEHRGSRQIWESTFSTFTAKFIVASSFLIPVVLLSLQNALYASIAWGALLITIFSYKISKKKYLAPFKAIAEHLSIAALVVIVTCYLGLWVATLG